jgi:inhibitor of KinA sporulation pathway (predicted exonuclease)
MVYIFAWCTINSWSQLEEKFYEFFRKTNEKKPITIETLAKAGLLDPQKASQTIEKHGKHHKSARLDFSGAKGPVYLSSDYYVISEDQVPAKKNEALPACSKSAKPTSQSARPTAY